MVFNKMSDRRCLLHTLLSFWTCSNNFMDRSTWVCLEDWLKNRF